ncbi:MAG: YhgE/Pip domain-containing protein [Hespellia sp.]|nr:YhgE/Pip domain-containing protein [Hespellia sp.]
MLKEEWKSLLHNKILLLVVIVIAAIPAIYAGLFLASMWDPYGNVDNLPVAVVNEDQSVKYNDSTLQVGDELIDNLKENDSLSFNFVDADAAAQGLKNGTYYMVITIPENFSGNAATLMDENPQKMELEYATNPGTNYIASKLSETALSKIKSSITEEVTKTYTQTVFDQIATVGDGMQEAADGSGEIKDGLGTASDGNKTISKNLKKLADSTLTFRDGADTLTAGIAAYTDGVDQVAGGAVQLNDGVSQLVDKVPILVTGIHSLNDGVKKYTGGVAQLHDNSPMLTAGTASLASGSAALSDGVTGYVNGVDQLANGARQLSGLESLGQVSGGISQLSDAVSGGATSAAQLSAGTQTLQNGLKTLNTTLANVDLSPDESTTKAMMDAGGNVEEALTICGDLAGKLQEMGTAATEVSVDPSESDEARAATIGDANAKIAEANGQIDAANDKISSDAAAMDSAANQLRDLAASADENGMVDAGALSDIANSLIGSDADLTTVEELSEDANSDMVVSGTPVQSTTSPADLTSIQADVQALSGTMYSLAANLTTIQEGAVSANENITANIGTIQTAVAQLYDGSQVVNNGTQQVVGGLDAAADSLGTLKTATASFPAAATGVKQLNAGFDQLNANDSSLLNGADGVAKGAETLSSGVTAYTAGIESLNSNSSELTNGTQQLADGSGPLADGVSQLKDGTNTLVSGTSQLVANNTTLNSGSAQLSNGAGQIQDGSAQLYDGSLELGSGLTKLSNGSDTLTSSLKDGAEEVKDSQASDNNIDMFAAPVTDHETKITTVENNGHAMAPYMMSVGLWVGCLAFCLMYPLTKYRGKLKSGFAWWASKASILYPLAILQGVMLIVLLHIFDGFTPVEMAKTVAFSCLASMAFTSVMYFFNSSLGKVGSFLMLVFMVVQLAGSAGTYPVQLSPSFVSVIHKWVPFTYTVDAFRSTISGGESILPSVLVMVGLIVVFTGLTIIEFQYRARRIHEEKPLLMNFLEEKGLA